jgi:protein-tyrosine phosphatase
MAEGFFHHQLKDRHPSLTVTSAGISALVDYPADLHAQAVMKHHGIDISGHRARQLTETLVREANLILVMTSVHHAMLTRQFLSAKGKTFLMGKWQNAEVPDPFKQPYEAFEKVYQQIELAWQDWKLRI